MSAGERADVCVCFSVCEKESGKEEEGISTLLVDSAESTIG